MKKVGYTMITLGFILAALVSVQDSRNTVSWGKYLPAFLLGSAGVVIIRIAKRRKTMESDSRGDDLETLAGAIGRIVVNITDLNAEKESLATGDFHSRIDRLFRSDLDAFAEARESIAQRFGLEAYAAVMNEFAAGERYLNRVWSASVDGYADEVCAYVERAKEQFERTLGALKECIDSKGNRAL